MRKISKQVAQRIDQGCDQRVFVIRMVAAPGWPAQTIGLQIDRDNIAIMKMLSQKTGLCSDVLNFIMPVITRTGFFADRPIDRVAIGQRIEKSDRYGDC
jgi:hypothetical protein